MSVVSSKHYINLGGSEMIVYRATPDDVTSGVRVGKAFRFTVEAADEAAARAEVDDMCRRFLTNPVIEDATISVAAGAPA